MKQTRVFLYLLTVILLIVWVVDISCNGKKEPNYHFVTIPCNDTILSDSGLVIFIGESSVRVYDGETIQDAFKRMDSTYGVTPFTQDCYERFLKNLKTK